MSNPVAGMSRLRPQEVLKVTDLSLSLESLPGSPKVVDNVSLSVLRGEVFGLVGESGSGKTMIAKALAGVLDPIASVTSGKALFDNHDLLALSAKKRRDLAGFGIGIVFQDALSALNPTYTIGHQVSEPFVVRLGLSRSDAKKRVIDLLDKVGISDPAGRYSQYPHQLSGGMRQRVLIAIAIALGPKLLIADEPTTALDVTVQAQVMELLEKLRQEEDMTLVFISHDLALVRSIADSVGVMYSGKIIEQGRAKNVFGEPQHPYTQGLISSIPSGKKQSNLMLSIPGAPPPMLEKPSGCLFAPRCHKAQDVCRQSRPLMQSNLTSETNHSVACHFPGGAS